ncbi:AAA family ATPase [Micromonospora profundi]|uniref:AAA family ATPase n=1 Tax=Micromonospora profundi TaxID=1420889 RepID=A0AAJ6HZA4_9ACTN|nr:LuxR family transcriptional regulator [Micromonospora profundi]NJC15662.1 DNA-binding NarL/FixJ family response regulator [Micromonospora profundi]WLS47124.1 AAA family ATPase [Micromonospora profundi]
MLSSESCVDRGIVVGGLFGRSAELAQIERFLESIRSRGDIWMLRGDAGIGKSAILAATGDVAADKGMRVLRASGSEFEAAISYSILHQLLLPLRAEIERLPPGLRDALTVALGLGPGPAPAALLVCNAALSLLAAAAKQAPIVLLVDDVQWADRPSAVALGFIARRVELSPIGVVVSSRTGTASHLDWRGLAELETLPLTREASGQLVDARFPGLPPHIRQSLLDLAQGNPLALVELAGTLMGSAAHDWEPTVVVPLTERLEQLYSRRIAELPHDTRCLLLIATFEGHGDLRVLRAITDLAHLAPAERAQLLTVDDAAARVTFRHPLIKSAVVASATHEERRLAHLAIADALAGDQERYVWHLAAATDGPDETVAALLEQSAPVILQRGDVLGAVAAMARAAEMSATRENRARRMVEAAYLGAEAGGAGNDLDMLLADARAVSPDSADSLRAATAAALLMLDGDGDLHAAIRLLGGAVEIGDHGWRGDDPAVEAAMQTLLQLCWYASDPESWTVYQRALSRLTDPSDVLAVGSAIIPDPVRTGAAARPALDALLATLTGEKDFGRVMRIGFAAFYLDRLGDIRDSSWRVLQYGREGGAPRLQVGALMYLCLDDYATGRWEEGRRLAEEGQQLCSTRVSQFLIFSFLYCRALLAAGRGDVGEAFELADEMTRWAQPRGVGIAMTIAYHPRVLAAAAQGDYESAYRYASAISPAGVLAPYVQVATSVMFDLVEAALRTGRTAEARAHADAMRAADVAAISPRMALIQCGVDALVLGDDAAVARLEEALAEPSAERWLFDASRIRLAFAESLRRRRAPSAARAHLLNARIGFAAMGAEPWLARTVHELRATGYRRGPAHRPPVALTAQELEIADLAAGGLTNKQIAERLYISHRTVSAHLHRIYPKLGITTRAGLRDALAGQESTDRHGSDG